MPSYHWFKNNVKTFLKGKAERNVALEVLWGEEVYDETFKYACWILGVSKLINLIETKVCIFFNGIED